MSVPRPHRLDRQGVQHDLHRRSRGLERGTSGKSAIDLSEGKRAPVALLVRRARCWDKVRALPDVAEAEGSVNGRWSQLIGKDGKAIVYGGAPNFGFSIARGESRFNPLTLVEGSWPKENEIVIDESTAGKGEVSRSARSSLCRPRARFSCLVCPGSSGSAPWSTIGGATLAGFDLPTGAGACSPSRASSTRSRSPRTGGVTDQTLEQEILRDPPARHAGAKRRGAGTRGRQRNGDLTFSS